MQLSRAARSVLAAASLAGCLLAGGLPAAAQDTVVVPKHVIYPGEAITSNQVSEVRFNRNRSILSSVAVVPEDVEGKVARRTLLPGRMIPLNSLRDAYAVEAGKPVPVIFVDGGMEISVTGVPLQPGSAGDVIRVRNIDSGAVLVGTVMADGTVRVSAT